MPEETSLFVHLLGPPGVLLGGVLHPFPADKRSQLLAYLAWRGDWVERGALADLFWPDTAPDTARVNFRQLLSRVRAFELAGGLEVRRERLRWPVPTDLAHFTRAVEEERWEQALGHHHGPLLAGLGVAGSGEFNAWLDRERGRVQGLWRLALLRRAEDLEAAGSHFQAAELLEPLLEGELDEEALHAQVRALLRDGGRERARRAHAAFVARLRGEFGLEPTAALEQLGQTVGAPGREPPCGPPPRVQAGGEPVPAPRSPLPTPTTSFVGRDLELAEVGRLLSGPDCRLLTLTGPGGIGKTRLALEAARTLAPHFPGGAWFVPLDAVRAGALIPTQIAGVLGAGLEGHDPWEAVARLIAGGRTLLVLDNFEHLLEGARRVQDLLGRCPGLRLLVTSRERLGVEAEWLLPVRGLDYPEGAAVRGVHSEQFDAVGLFAERARRVRPDFTPGGEDLPHLLTICRLVEGSPLGLELAAVWVRALPLAEIARELGEDLDFLGPGERERPVRHRGPRAVFEHSWRLLGPAEQRALAGLAVFRGGFRPEAAREVVGAPLPVLASLVDKSLLRAHPSGRYGRHALLYAYTREKLAGEGEAREAGLRARHGAFFLGVLRDLGGALRGPGQKAALAALDADLENVRLAWGWAVEHRRAGDLGQGAAPLADYALARARHREGADLLGEAAAALGDTEPAHRAALCQLRVAGAPLLHRLGHSAEATHWAECGLGLARELGQDGAARSALILLGSLAWRRGDFRPARRLLEEAVTLAAARGDQPHLAEGLSLLGNVTLDSGDLPGAGRHYEAALALHRELGHQAEVVRLLNNLGCLAAYQGHLGESVARLEEGLRLARDIGLPRLTAQLLSSLAETRHEQGEFGCAAATAREALDLARRSGDRRLEGILLMDLGRTATASGELDGGQRQLREGLSLLWSLGEVPQVLRTLARWAEWHLAASQPGRAAALLDLVVRHPKTKGVDRDPARRLRAQLGGGEGDAPEDVEVALRVAVAQLVHPGT